MSQAAVIYEVNLQIDAEIADAYQAWLAPHVQQVLALPGFVDAEILAVIESTEMGVIGLSVRYRLRDMAALDVYLRDHAPAMRAEGEQRFAGRFRASRRILRPIS